MRSKRGILPDWNFEGILPPIYPSPQGPTTERSPYLIELSTLIHRFNTSEERFIILEGFFKFRKELGRIGIVSGFQWLNGSFVENIEAQENRAPNDLDIVTFFNIPEGKDEQILSNENLKLFDNKHLKSIFKLDGYFCVLGGPLSDWEVRHISYWYSLWSHRRDNLWKGFVQVELDPKSDEIGMKILNNGGKFNDE